MAEPYFFRNVLVIIHDEARLGECKVASIMSHAIAQAKICAVTDSGRQAAQDAIGKDYSKTWAALKLFHKIDLPLWIECQMGPDSKMGCLVAKAGPIESPSFFMRRFMMKKDMVIQPINPVFMGWSHNTLLNAKKPMSVSSFVRVQSLNSDHRSKIDTLPEATKTNGLATAGLMIGVMASMLNASTGPSEFVLSDTADSSNLSDHTDNSILAIGEQMEFQLS